MLTDSHAHLDAPQFEDDLEDVVERAEDSGVVRILTVGCLGSSSHDSELVLRLLGRYEGLYAAFGVHPHDASTYSEKSAEQIQNLLGMDKVVGLGEIGLDHFYRNSPINQQREAFLAQARLACRLGAPIIVHSRDAEEETCQVLEMVSGEFPGQLKGVVHCFTGTWEMASRCLDLGFHLGFGGILTFKNSDTLRSVAARVPLERLLVETDSPYLAPQPQRGQRNEPSFVTHVVAELSRLKEVPVSRMAELSGENFSKLFLASGGFS